MPSKQGIAKSGRAGGRLRPLHEAVDHLFLAGLLERNRQLVAVDLDHLAVAELLVKHPVVEREFRNGCTSYQSLNVPSACGMFSLLIIITILGRKSLVNLKLSIF